MRVENSGNISAGGDGISAESNAVAVAEVDQDATQENENSQSADITARSVTSRIRVYPAVAGVAEVANGSSRPSR